MLITQEYLRQFSGPDTAILAIENEYGIVTNIHEDGRVIFNYRQGVSQKTDPLVRECRGLVLDSKNDWNLVARAFPRFFNLGEHREEQDSFQWLYSFSTEKLDGSLIQLYYYNGEWHINTRGSFGDGITPSGNKCWRDLVEFCLPNNWKQRIRHDYNYIFELCSPYNKVVKNYPITTLYLLSIYDDEIELSHNSVREYEYGYSFYDTMNVKLPDEYIFNNADDVVQYIDLRKQEDPTWEGVVVRDYNDLRIKCKSPSYVKLHQLVGGIQITTKLILSIIASGETDEVLTYYPELSDRFNIVKDQVNEVVEKCNELWYSYKDLEVQKDFALAVKDTQYASILFNCRKNKVNPQDVIYQFTDFMLDNELVR